MEHECKCGGKCKEHAGEEHECGKHRALETAVDQYHKWDGMVFKGKDGVPPLLNVELTAYTMDFFLRETGLLKLLFAYNPSYPEETNTNMATVLYDKDRLVGIAIEYGNDSKAYIAMEQLDRREFICLPDWRSRPRRHADEMRQRIKKLTGRDIGLIKCADLEKFFGNLGKVVENPNTLEMLLEGVKFACNAVSNEQLSIQPEPKFFSYLRMLHPFARRIDAGKTAAVIEDMLPDFSMGLVLQNRKKQFAAVEIYAEKGRLGFYDCGDLSDFTNAPLEEVAAIYKEGSGAAFAFGLSTEFLYNAVHAALTHSPYKLGKAVFNAVRKREIVVC